MSEDDKARGMDAPGVARDGGFSIQGNTGRRCENKTCIQRETGDGNVVFKRCGRCKRVWYCSAHCQRTHWMNGHKEQCQLATT